MTMMNMMKGVAVIASLGLMLAPPSSMVSADDEFACAPEGKMKKVQLSSFSMEGTLLRCVAFYFAFDVEILFCYLSSTLLVVSSHCTLHALNPSPFIT
jgi:hypothetical protein